VFLCCQINYAIAAAAHSNYSVVPTEAVGSIVSLNTSATPAPTAPLKLTFALNSASQSAIADYVNSLTDPTSPNYHHWLTPQQFGGLFGPSSADISTVVAYLSKLGLTNITVWPDHMFVTASTTKQQAEAAFGVSISGYSRSSADVARGLSKTYYAPNKLPLIDSSVALHITAIFGLSSAVQAIPVGSLTGVAHPDASASGCFDPIDLSNAYNTTPLHKSGLLGKGQTIAIFSPTEFTQSDITRFATANGITSPIVNIVKVTGQNGVSGATDYDAQVEACIDIETVLGQAPAATVNVYESPNDGGFEIFQQVEKDDPNILTESYGIDENEVNQSYASAYETIRQALSAEGVTIFVASGDTGAFDGYNQSTVTVSVDSSSAYVTAVGGTELSALNAGAWNGEKAWTYKDGTTSGNSGSSGGISIYFPMPTWQTGTGVTTKYSDGMRQVPDVAALASTPYYDISVEGGWYGFGGTSCASPLWAGAISLIEESMGTRLGNINPKLYALAATAAPPFHDITSGNDGLYSCTPGWDYVTGWGSADFSKLLTGFGGVPPTITSFTPATGGPGTAVTIVGTNLASASSITFGGAAATTITSDTATQIVVQVPTAAVTGPITITTPQGSVTSKTNFTVTPAFMLSSSAGSLSVADNKTGTNHSDEWYSSPDVCRAHGFGTSCKRDRCILADIHQKWNDQCPDFHRR
jgi:kumamolisin